jgi:hypothetical protein
MLKRLAFVVVLVLLIEAVLRFAFGFGELPLYYSSMQYEYALTPGQDLFRFGNRFYINKHGMRSEPLGDDEVRILKFGDSVLNGGVLTDQSELASTRLEAALAHAVPGRKVRVLNVSAGSWGPDNAWAWMQEHGDFDAVLIVLVFSSHDLDDIMTFHDVVGKVPFYPEKQPATAISDMLGWAWSRRFEYHHWNKLPRLRTVPDEQPAINPGWEQFAAYHFSAGKGLLVYHHPSLEEVHAGQYNEQGHILRAWLAQLGVPVVSGLAANADPAYYRDEIHPNATGQAAIATALEPALRNFLHHGIQ